MADLAGEVHANQITDPLGQHGCERDFRVDPVRVAKRGLGLVERCDQVACSAEHARLIARRLNPNAPDRAAEAARAQVRRDVPAGRSRLAVDGVLPWAAYDDGELPAAWWRDRAFELAVDVWLHAANTDPARPATTAEQELQATARRIAAQLVPERLLLRIAHGSSARQPAASWRWTD